MPRAFLRDHEALSQVLGIMVAGSLFVAVFGVVVLVSIEQDPGSTQVEAASVQSHAASLADLILTSTGEGWFSLGAKCVATQENPAAFSPDHVTRFGLAAEGCSGSERFQTNLSYMKLANLQHAAYGADPTNGHLDYEEARAALGLDAGGRDVHIRTQPLLPTLGQILALGLADEQLRPLYVGAYEKSDGNGAFGLEVAAGLEEKPSSLEVWVLIRNNGIITTAFEVGLTLPLKDGDVNLIQHSPVILPGLSHTVTFKIPKSAGWQWQSPEIHYLVSDVAQPLVSGTLDASGASMSADAAAKIFDVQAAKVETILQGPNVLTKVHYAAYDAKGQAVAHSDWKLEVTNSLGLLVASDTTLHPRGWESFQISLPGIYDVRLKTLAGATLAESKMVVVSVALGEFSTVGDAGWAPRESVPVEAGLIAALAKPFSPYVFSEAYHHPLVPHKDGGDILPDVKTVMNNELRSALIDDQGTPSPADDVATLEHYNILVVGSNVNQDAMSSRSAQEAVRDWVLAGGTLIVLGSDDQASQWLQPIFHASLNSASGGIATPDENHPILRAPNVLDYLAYNPQGAAWNFTRDQDAESFTRVLVQGADALLAVSDHGAFGAGRVILMSFQLHDLVPGTQAVLECTPADLTADCEALKLLHNLLMQAYNGLFIDYGPPLPADRPVGTTTRVASLWHPETGAHVALRVQIYVF